MEFNYEYIFFKYIYEKLELFKLDDWLTKEGIKMLDPNGEKRISKYFSLVSTGDSSEFDESTKEEYKTIFDKDLEILKDGEMCDLAINFILKTYENYFHLNGKVEYNYYGPHEMAYVAPSNSIVIGLNYNKFDIESSNYDDEVFRQNGIVVDVLNYIQNNLLIENKTRVSAVAYDEVVLSQEFIQF